MLAVVDPPEAFCLEMWTMHSASALLIWTDACPSSEWHKHTSLTELKHATVQKLGRLMQSTSSMSPVSMLPDQASQKANIQDCRAVSTLLERSSCTKPICGRRWQSGGGRDRVRMLTASKPSDMLSADEIGHRRRRDVLLCVARSHHRTATSSPSSQQAQRCIA